MRVKVVDWNVNGFATTGQPDLLGSLDWDIACLQEVTEDSWPLFRAAADHGDMAFNHLPPLAGSGPRFACAILTRGHASINDFMLLPDMPSPERAATARVTLGTRQIWVGSWASPPGVSWGKAGKGRQVRRFAAWLRDRDAPVVFGMDRNAPKWEHHDLADDEWWNDREPLMFGPNRVHDLRDTFRDYLANNPDAAARTRALRPDGPLAVTYERAGHDCRYDAIYASPEFTVHHIDHHWDEARAAGSDHGLVSAALELHD